MRINGIVGYTFTALLYFLAWWNPDFGNGQNMIRWVAFEKLCLAEFLTCHAVTLLGGFAMAAEFPVDKSENYSAIFWLLVAVYALFGAGAYLFHRDHAALLGFYLMIAIRGLGLLSLRTPDEDVMRAEVVKNFAMFVPMMALIFAILSSDPMGPGSWQGRFLRGQFGLLQKIWYGRPLLIVTGYYLFWAFIEWKWPLRMSL